MAVQLPDVGTITRNPLEPLSADEIRRTSEILREQRDLGPTVRFVTVCLHEPPKQDVLRHDREGAEAPERAAFVVLYDREHQQTVEAVVSLSSGVVSSWQVVEDVQPSVMLEEFFSSEEITRADPRWQAAMRRRGPRRWSFCAPTATASTIRDAMTGLPCWSARFRCTSGRSAPTAASTPARWTRCAASSLPCRPRPRLEQQSARRQDHRALAIGL